MTQPFLVILSFPSQESWSPLSLSLSLSLSVCVVCGGGRHSFRMGKWILNDFPRFFGVFPSVFCCDPLIYFSLLFFFFFLPFFFLLKPPAMEPVVLFEDRTASEPEASRSLLVRNLNRTLKVEALLEEFEVCPFFVFFSSHPFAVLIPPSLSLLFWNQFPPFWIPRIQRFGPVQNVNSRHLREEGFVVVDYFDVRDCGRACKGLGLVLSWSNPSLCQPGTRLDVHYFTSGVSTRPPPPGGVGGGGGGLKARTEPQRCADSPLTLPSPRRGEGNDVLRTRRRPGWSRA